jgi:hypothetical protein
MAHFWTKLDPACWAVLPLAGTAYAFMDVRPYVRRIKLPAGPGTLAVLVRTQAESGNAWILVASPGAGTRVNGEEPLLSVTLIHDRDEIYVGNGRRFYFSTERLPCVEPFPGAAQQVACGRCHQQIAVNSPTVACPGCGTVCHESDEMHCWTYAGTTTCPLCDYPNNLPDADYRWCPDDL